MLAEARLGLTPASLSGHAAALGLADADEVAEVLALCDRVSAMLCRMR